MRFCHRNFSRTASVYEILKFNLRRSECKRCISAIFAIPVAHMNLVDACFIRLPLCAIFQPLFAALFRARQPAISLEHDSMTWILNPTDCQSPDARSSGRLFAASSARTLIYHFSSRAKRVVPTYASPATRAWRAICFKDSTSRLRDRPGCRGESGC